MPSGDCHPQLAQTMTDSCALTLQTLPHRQLHKCTTASSANMDCRPWARAMCASTCRDFDLWCKKATQIILALKNSTPTKDWRKSISFPKNNCTDQLQKQYFGAIGQSLIYLHQNLIESSLSHCQKYGEIPSQHDIDIAEKSWTKAWTR